jgi:hypothetical protein
MNEKKPWKCPNNHVLGQVIRNGSGIRVLLLYRQSVDPEAQRPAAVDVIATVEGHVADVRCSLCGMCRTWVPGEESIRKLLEGMGR